MDIPLHSLDWSLVQSFLLVADHGSLSAASRASHISQPTLGRQIKTMEEQLGVSLFERHSKGLALSDTGLALLPTARAMAEAAAQFATQAAGQDMSVKGTVRITASEFVSHYVLPEIIADIRRTHPDIQLELHPTDESDNLLFREADIAVRMYRPTQLEIVTKFMGVFELGFFASEDYLRRRGTPTRLEDLTDHDLLGYDKSDRFIRGAAEFGWHLTNEDFPVRCDLQSLHGALIAAGCGIGVLSKTAGARLPGLRPLLPEQPVPGLEIWLSTHEALRKTPRIRAVWNALEGGLAPWTVPNSDAPVMKQS